MLLLAATGLRPSAAAWSTAEEERRKALVAYLLAALPAVVWDNIPRGAQISCPHIEAACTASHRSDRLLGLTELVDVAASSVMFFTGNNITPRGDLGSRSLQVRLEVERSDPENRPFVHPDPIAWTEANRGKILRAIYTILLGNPVLRSGPNIVPETRFKTWWTLVGSAVEHAAQQHSDAVKGLTADRQPASQPKPISFRDLFLEQESDDEQTGSLVEILAGLAEKWPDHRGFRASDLARLVNDKTSYLETDRQLGLSLAEFLFPDRTPDQKASAKGIARRLKAHLDEPVKHGARTLTLKKADDRHSKVNHYWVRMS